MGFLPKAKEDVLVRSGRHCCICHKFCGTKIEVHHIKPKSEGGKDTFDNAIALCFDCHADMSTYDHKHPKGTKYTESELIRHRDNWYERVSGNIGLANKDQLIETDKNVYRLIVKVLPWDGSIRFLRTNNFAGFSFENSRLNDIYNFVDNCSNPAFEFIDPDLEGLRESLLSNCHKLLHLIAFETFPVGTGERNSVPPEWEIEQPERFGKVVDSIHAATDAICETYDALVRTATRKLGILPESIT